MGASSTIQQVQGHPELRDCPKEEGETQDRIYSYWPGESAGLNFTAGFPQLQTPGFKKKAPAAVSQVPEVQVHSTRSAQK